MIPSARFRKERSITDNIYILMHLMQRKRNQEEGRRKIYMFADLKAVFDKMDRGRFWETLRGKSVSEYLVRKIEKMYEETEMRIKMKNTIQNNERSKAGLCDESIVVQFI